jgi:hypothetical protein
VHREGWVRNIVDRVQRFLGWTTIPVAEEVLGEGKSRFLASLGITGASSVGDAYRKNPPFAKTAKDRAATLEGAAAVEHQDVTGHEFGANEEHDRVADVLRTTGSGKWGALDEIGLPLWRIAGHGDGAGSDGVDANFGGKLLGENASEKNHASFGNGVGKKFAPAREPTDVGEIDDDAVGRLREIRRGGLATEEGSLEIGVEGGIPSGFGSFAEFGFEEIGGAVDEDIEALEFRRDARNEIVNLLDASEVGLQSNGASAEFFDFVDDFEGLLLRFTVVDGDVGAFGGDPQSDGAAKALPCPGNEGDAAMEGVFGGHGVGGLGKGSTGFTTEDTRAQRKPGAKRRNVLASKGGRYTGKPKRKASPLKG